MTLMMMMMMMMMLMLMTLAQPSFSIYVPMLLFSVRKCIIVRKVLCFLTRLVEF